MARPRKVIDPKQVEQLASIGCSGEEIAGVLGCHRDTIYARFSDSIKSGHARRDASVRRTQYELAVKKQNVVMAIWLGKQHLGQRDKSDVSITTISDEELEAEVRRRIALVAAGLAGGAKPEGNG